MKYNTADVGRLAPDYMGFIWYGKSPRNFEGSMPVLPKTIKKVGVFVDAPIEFVVQKVQDYKLDVVQLHGEESPDYVVKLRKELTEDYRDLSNAINIWKVFAIQDTFNFERLKPFESHVDAFLFDTKGKNKGGNGYTFNWEVLQEYPSSKPIVLSGGIGLDVLTAIKTIKNTQLPIMALDINSKFEMEPGLKDTKQIKKFINAVSEL